MVHGSALFSRPGPKLVRFTVITAKDPKGQNGRIKLFPAMKCVAHTGRRADSRLQVMHPVEVGLVERPRNAA